MTPNPRNPKNRQPMTIVAGFPGRGMFDSNGTFQSDMGYVLLAADSEESGPILKTSVRKIAKVEKANWKALIGGAGGGTFIDFAIQEIEQRITGASTLTDLREQIERIVTDIHLNRISRLKDPEQEFDLLCALWVRDQGVQLVLVRCAHSLALTEATTIGFGEHLARYIIATYHPKALTLFWTMRLAVYLLSQVKRYVVSCGGSSQVAWIGSNGVVGELSPEDITDRERSNAAVMEVGPRGLLYLVDPEGWGRDWAKVDKAIDDIAQMVKENIRRSYPDKPSTQPQLAAEESSKAQTSSADQT